MKKTFILFRLFLISLGWNVIAADALAAVDVNVITFNVRVPVDQAPNDWASRKPRVLSIINTYNPDFFGVQEALPYVVSDIDNGLPIYSPLGRGREADGSGEGSQIFYRTDRWNVDWSDQGTFQLSPTPDVPGSNGWGFSYLRICTWARFIEKTSGKSIYVFNTHFPLAPNERLLCAQLIASRIASRKNQSDPVILTGDMNACEGEAAMNYFLGQNGSPISLKDTYRVLYPNDIAGTFHGFSGNAGACKIDYVYSMGYSSVLEAQIIKDSFNGLYPSDHFPVRGKMRFYASTNNPDCTVRSPYSGTPVQLPGTIEAENYDKGCNGVTYFDNTSGNSGNAYRTDDVDIEACTEGGFDVGYIDAGEWMEYTVNIPSGKYTIDFRVASNATTNGSLRLLLDGVDLAPAVTISPTAGWQNWKTVSIANININGGDNKKLRFIADAGLFNINSITLTKIVTATRSPYLGAPVNIPGIIEAENYDNGGAGIAYSDASIGNEGSTYRNDDVDIEACSEGGYDVGWTAANEWLEYSVQVANTDNYQFFFRTSGMSNGAVHLELDGKAISGSVAIPATGGWQTWTTTAINNIPLSAGQHILRLAIEKEGFNLNYVQVKVAASFLHAQGKQIVNDKGSFQIRAINLGNWMLQEGYMLNCTGGNNISYMHQIKKNIETLVGTAKRDQFYTDYLNNYVTKRDIDSIASWGFNAIRLPMHYNLFTPLDQPDVYLEQGFAMVDTMVKWCKANKIYLILDLHAAPGGESSGDISDYIASQPSLWESAANRDKTVKLWRKIAERYAYEPWVGGYDLINETNWPLSGNSLLLQLMKDITAAIRQVDTNHILFVEGNGYANDYTNMTPPWDNNMAYSFHKYWNYNDAASINWVLAIRDANNVPIWLGEFGENSNHWMAEAVDVVNAQNIGWAVWPYKKMASISGICSFKEPAGWTKMVNYWKGTGPQPSALEASTALDEIIANIKTQNCSFNRGYLRALFGQPGNNSTAPFTTITLPGKIAAIAYDEGKNGYAYSDVSYQTLHVSTGTYTAWNNGWNLRNDGVDIDYSQSENTFVVGWTETNEWLNYTVTVNETGTYDVSANISGNGGNISISVDGTIALTNISLPSTGAWDTYQTASLGKINLTAGKHTLRTTIAKSGFNLNYLEFVKSIPNFAFGGTPALIPGKIEAENYDTGGSTISYSDDSPGNSGNSYRNEDVDIEACSEGGFNTGWMDGGEWMNYTVNVTQSGTYNVTFRFASTGTTGGCRLELAGSDVLGSVTFTNTSGWQQWQDVTMSNVNLKAGIQTLRILNTGSGFNLNNITFALISPSTSTVPTQSLVNTSVVVYPNPMLDANILQFTYPVNENSVQLTVSVKNTFGVTIKEFTFSGVSGMYEGILDLGDLGAGIYYITFGSSQGSETPQVIR